YSRSVSGKLRRQSTSVDSGLRAIGGDYSQAADGVGMEISIKLSREATYIDEDGAVHSAFQENLVLLLAEAYYG
ncbi:phage major capsid protein, partial [Streptomyces sp. A73]|nr:phage major capsid protein [Streptomyces sp. A73]